MHWHMNRRCNFNCEYCFRGQDDGDRSIEDPACARYDAEHISRSFDRTGRVWQIYMTGGEPLLYPGFVELAEALTRKHYISVSTNLSTPNAYELADAVEPARVGLIHANLHILERSKTSGSQEEFLRKFLCFQERGFDIRLVYVAYPPLLRRIEQDIKRLRDNGAGRIEAKVFQGKYKGRRYPRGYSGNERALLMGLGLDDFEQQILAGRVSFLGRKCRAGYRAFTMDTAGNVTRCSTLKDEYGNLFTDTFRPGSSARRCPARVCSCAYQGLNGTGVGGSCVPGSIIARPVRFAVSASEWIGALRVRAQVKNF